MTIEADAELNAFHIDPIHWDRKYYAGHGEWGSYEDGDAPEEWHHLDHGEAAEPCNTWLEVPYTAIGDYSGSGAVGEANYRSMLEILEDIDPDGERYCELHGGHGSRSLFIRADIDEIDGDNQVKDALAALASYPILDEQQWSEVEEEWKQEAWSDYARDDFRHELRKRFDDIEEHTDELEDEYLDHLWWEHAEQSGRELWIDESSTYMTCLADRGAELVPWAAVCTAIVRQALGRSPSCLT